MMYENKSKYLNVKNLPVDGVYSTKFLRIFIEYNLSWKTQKGI